MTSTKLRSLRPTARQRVFPLPLSLTRQYAAWLGVLGWKLGCIRRMGTCSKYENNTRLEGALECQAFALMCICYLGGGRIQVRTDLFVIIFIITRSSAIPVRPKPFCFVPIVYRAINISKHRGFANTVAATPTNCCCQNPTYIR